MKNNMKVKDKKMISFKKWGALLLIMCLLLFLFFTPERALRTYIFVTGYPMVAMKTDLMEVSPELATAAMLKPNEILYELSTPPIEKATEGELRYYAVEKVGFLYVPYFFGNF